MHYVASWVLPEPAFGTGRFCTVAFSFPGASSTIQENLREENVKVLAICQGWIRKPELFIAILMMFFAITGVAVLLSMFCSLCHPSRQSALLDILPLSPKRAVSPSKHFEFPQFLELGGKYRMHF